MKKAQTWSMEAFVSIMVFLLALALFYVITAPSDSSEELRSEAEVVTKSLMNQKEFEDGVFDEAEATILIDEFAGLSEEERCDKIKEKLSTNKNVCVYFTYEDGTPVKYGSDTPLAFGCEGINIGDIACGAQN